MNTSHSHVSYIRPSAYILPSLPAHHSPLGGNSRLKQGSQTACKPQLLPGALLSQVICLQADKLGPQRAKAYHQLMEAQIATSDVKHWFWWLDRKQRAVVRKRKQEQFAAEKRVANIERQRKAIMTEAKAQLGLWSEVSGLVCPPLSLVSFQMSTVAAVQAEGPLIRLVGSMLDHTSCRVTAAKDFKRRFVTAQIGIEEGRNLFWESYARGKVEDPVEHTSGKCQLLTMPCTCLKSS